MWINKWLLGVILKDLLRHKTDSANVFGEVISIEDLEKTLNKYLIEYNSFECKCWRCYLLKWKNTPKTLPTKCEKCGKKIWQSNIIF